MSLNQCWGGAVYQGKQGRRLGPRQIRAARFRTRRFGHPGFDPDEVRRFLADVAAEVTSLHAEVAAARDEAARLRGALRDWESWYRRQFRG